MEYYQELHFESEFQDRAQAALQMNPMIESMAN